MKLRVSIKPKMIATVERDRIMGEEQSIEELIDFIDRLVFKMRGCPLSHLEKELLRGVLQGKRYSEIGDYLDSPLYYYSTEYISRYLAYNLWKTLTQVLQSISALQPLEKVHKRNLRECLQRAIKCARWDWADRVENQNFAENTVLDYWVGRESLIADCQKTLASDTRVIGLVGMAGVGKTALANRLTSDRVVRKTFPQVHWLRCQNETSIFEALVSLLLDKTAIHQYKSSYLVEALIEQLRSQPCLLIIDRIEAILHLDAAGHTHCCDRDLEEFFIQFLTTKTMPSRIVMTSQIDLRAIACDRHWQRLHIYEVLGLTEDEALQLFRLWGITTTEPYLQRLIEAYAGHPLALCAIASEIHQPPYQGNIAAYWSNYGSEIETAEQWPQPGKMTSPPRLERYSLRLADLVQTRIENSLNQLQQTSPLAVELLCLGAKQAQGCDRAAWLSWLRDRSPDEALLAFQALQRYCLLQKDQQGDRLLYRVHPLLLGVVNSS